MNGLFDALGDALRFAFGMTWEVLWALILGFALSSASNRPFIPPCSVS